MDCNYTEFSNTNTNMTNDVNVDLIILASSSIISFIVGWGLFRLTERSKTNSLISQSVKMMIIELEKIKKSIDENKKPPIKVDEDEPLSFKINLNFGGFFTSSYESMMISGALKEIDIKTQEKIIDLYEHIRLYNDMKKQLQSVIMASVNTVNLNFVENLRKFSDSLESTIKSIGIKIDEILPQLQTMRKMDRT